MPVPTYDELQDPGLEMLKIARERLGGGYDGTTTVTSPISLKDLSNLSGGNAGGLTVCNPLGSTMRIRFRM